MKIKHILCGMILITVSSAPLFAQETKKASGQPSDNEKALMAYAAPGKMHEMLARITGMWQEDIIMWMAPGAPPTKSTSTCSNRMIMGGRYLEGRTRGSFNGMPFEGTSITAYDNAKKVFINTWIDNMGTGIMVSEGPYNEKTRVIEMKGSCMDPLTGKEMRMRQTLKFIDDNTQQMEMFMTQNDKEYKSMEIKLTRRDMAPPPEKKSDLSPAKEQSVPLQAPEQNGDGK